MSTTENNLPLYCVECELIAEEYDLVWGSYFAAMDEFLTRREAASAVDYNRLRALSDFARLDSEIAQLKVQQHKLICSLRITAEIPSFPKPQEAGNDSGAAFHRRRNPAEAQFAA